MGGQKVFLPSFRPDKNIKSAALAGNRTRVNCLEGSYAHHYTTNAHWKPIWFNSLWRVDYFGLTLMFRDLCWEIVNIKPKDEKEKKNTSRISSVSMLKILW